MHMSWIAAYKNRFPGGHVDASETTMDVYDKSGAHRVALRKDGAGQWQCVSETLGLSDGHDLAPIPRDARVYKVVNGKIAMDEFAEDRQTLSAEFDDGSGRIMSMAEMRAESKEYQFDDKGRVVSRPSKQVSAAPAKRVPGGLNL